MTDETQLGKRVETIEPIDYVMFPGKQHMAQGTIVYHHREDIMYKILWDDGCSWSNLDECEFRYLHPGESIVISEV